MGERNDVQVAIMGIMLMFGDTVIDRQEGIKRCKEALAALDAYEAAWRAASAELMTEAADEMRVQGELADMAAEEET